MKRKFQKSILISLFFMVVIFFGASGFSYALSDYGDSESYYRRFHLVMKGGYAYAESTGGLADLQLELQFSLSSNVRVGLGTGYLNRSDNIHMMGNLGNFGGSMMGGMMGSASFGQMVGFSGHDHSLRIIPITLSLYYVLPLSPKLDVFMTGGAGYYFGSYRDQSDQKRNSFGPHLGLGADIKVTHRIGIIAEGLYRFVRLKGFESELHEGFGFDMEGEHEEGFWHYHHHDEDWHFHMDRDEMGQMGQNAVPFDMSLNGIILRLGIKFSF